MFVNGEQSVPRATKEVSEQTAKTILDVATNHFRERGFAGTDLVSVASEAGVTRGAVYHHYAGKKALFEAVVARLHVQLQNRIEAAAAEKGDLWEQLLVGCEAFIDAAIDPSVQQILLVEAPAVLGWDAWRSLDEANSFASLTDVLQQLEDAGEIRTGSATAAARLLSGAMNEAVLWIASEPNPDAAKAQIIETLSLMALSLRHVP